MLHRHLRGRLRCKLILWRWWKDKNAIPDISTSPRCWPTHVTSLPTQNEATRFRFLTPTTRRVFLVSELERAFGLYGQPDQRVEAVGPCWGELAEFAPPPPPPPGGGYSSSSRAGRLGRTLWPQNSTSVAETEKGGQNSTMTPPTLEKGGSIFYISMKSLQKKGVKNLQF